MRASRLPTTTGRMSSRNCSRQTRRWRRTFGRSNTTGWSRSWENPIVSSLGATPDIESAHREFRGRRMDSRPKAVVSWSSGKDSAFALQEIRAADSYELVGVLTTVTAEFARVSMHGVREELLDAQIASLGLPGRKIYIPSPCPNSVYEREMTSALTEAKRNGVTHVLFGDL